MITRLKNRSLLALMSAVAVLTAVSCKKEDEDEGLLPQITLANTMGYAAHDTTVAKGAALKVGVRAAKSEENDVLIKFNQSVSFDGNADSTIQNISLSGGDGDVYSKDIDINTRNTAGKEKYTFTVINKDGLVNNVSLTVTVQ